MYRIAILSYHTSPLAPLGAAETGGMNVYVRELACELADRGHLVDVFTRRSDAAVPETLSLIGAGHSTAVRPARLVHIEAGPSHRLEKARLSAHVDAFISGVAAFAG
ncbi:MAG: glycosyltransferase, partial [Dehalococcoidia bacterium]|nr:glycosyltransferase [Dehalococcoidia bacterium]